MPNAPDHHHRNETLSGSGDPQLSLLLGRELAGWTGLVSAGVSAPVGRTEPNPFELGRLGLRHEHSQFGTGTWDPVLGIAAGRPLGPVDVRLHGFGRWAVMENGHGYRAGDRYSLGLDVARKLTHEWSGDVGLAVAHEEPETWAGRIETEGNLGRTDLFLSLGAARSVGAIGALSANLQVPLASRTTGEQVKIPIVVSLAWQR